MNRNKPVDSLAKIYKHKVPYKWVDYSEEHGFYYNTLIRSYRYPNSNDKKVLHGTIWSNLFDTVKSLFLEDNHAYLVPYRNDPEKHYIHVPSKHIKSIRDMNRPQQDLAVEMLGEMIQVFNKYYVLANPEIIYNGQAYKVKELEEL